MHYLVLILTAALLVGCGAVPGKDQADSADTAQCAPEASFNPRQKCLEASERRIAACPQIQPEYGTVEACLAEAVEQRASCDSLPDETVAAGCVDSACLSRNCTPGNPCGKCTLGKGCTSNYEGTRCGWSWGQCYCKTVVTGPATCACKCK